MPTGMSITPKKTLALISQMLFCRSMLSFQIQRVAKMSPATMCDHMAVTPALDDNPAPIPTMNPSGCNPLFAKSMRPFGFKSITANQMTIGPKKKPLLIHYLSRFIGIGSQQHGEPKWANPKSGENKENCVEIHDVGFLDL